MSLLSIRQDLSVLVNKRGACDPKPLGWKVSENVAHLLIKGEQHFPLLVSAVNPQWLPDSRCQVGLHRGPWSCHLLWWLSRQGWVTRWKYFPVGLSSWRPAYHHACIYNEKGSYFCFERWRLQKWWVKWVGGEKMILKVDFSTFLSGNLPTVACWEGTPLPRFPVSESILLLILMFVLKLGCGICHKLRASSMYQQASK